MYCMLYYEQVDSFPPEVEIRAVLESQFLARLLYAKACGLQIGKFYMYDCWIDVLWNSLFAGFSQIQGRYKQTFSHYVIFWN